MPTIQARLSPASFPRSLPSRPVFPGIALGFVFLVLTIVSASPRILAAEPLSLFDGKTLAGWEGNEAVWRVEDGVIVGGSMAGNPRNEFLATTRTYRNFILRLEYKLVGTEGFVNGGVQIRSHRINDPAHEMIGYQADIGAGYSGSLYDESRRRAFLQQAEKDLVASIERVGDWNRYEIRCEGPRVRIILNGRTTVDYTERTPGIDETGYIALQIHGACKAVISFRHLTIEELPDDLVPGTKVGLRRLEQAAPAAEGGEVIVTLGQGNLDRAARTGAMEAVLVRAFGGQVPRFRPMAWEGDTVYAQWREANFGAVDEQLRAIGATVAFVQFGGIEAFDGPERIEAFTKAYEAYLGQIPPEVRVVLLSPVPHESAGGTDPAVDARNEILLCYVEAIRDLAARRSWEFVDLFGFFRTRRINENRYTDDGMHLSLAGQEGMAREIVRRLGLTLPAATEDDSILRRAIAEKNRIWFECWRPANWPFAFGDRATQPYGEGVADAPMLKDLFVRHGAMLAEEDRRIAQMALSIQAGDRITQERTAIAEPAAATAGLVSDASEALEALTVAQGFRVELFADESLGVVKPTQICWDEQGRLWVACSPTYPQPLPGVSPGDYILVLEDTDGDGRADRATRFAENLTMVLGLELAGDGVYVCDYDQLVLLRDTDGDGRADRREVVLSGFGTGDTHQLINSISYGPDGTLWFSQGLHAYSRVETLHGVSTLEKAGLWRYHPKSRRLDSFFNGGKAGLNGWGVVFDDYGRMFHKSGDRAAGYYSTPGLVRLREPDNYDPVGVLFSSRSKTTSIEILGTDAWPEEYRDDVVIADYFGHAVQRHRLLDDGAGFRSEQLPDLLKSSRPDFRPVDVSGGPDGALYVADWHNPIIGHYQASYADPRRDRTRGRIWRIAEKSDVSPERPLLAGMSTEDLLGVLRSPERWQRQQARRLLFNRSDAEVLPALDLWWPSVSADDPAAARLLVDAAGIYQAHLAPRAALARAFVASHDPRLRAYGIRLVGAWAGDFPDAAEVLKTGVKDEHPCVRLEAVLAAAELDTAEAATTAVLAMDAPRDRFIDYALAQVLRALEPRWLPESTRPAIASREPYATAFRQASSRMRPVVVPGRETYESLCVACHQADGRGIPGIYPSLAGNEWVAGDVTRLIKIVLHGVTRTPDVVSGSPEGGLFMPPSALEDRALADVLTFVRSQFGNSAAAVSPAEVRRVRHETSDRRTPWLRTEL